MGAERGAQPTPTFRTDFSAINFLTLHPPGIPQQEKEGHCLGLGKGEPGAQRKAVA